MSPQLLDAIGVVAGAVLTLLIFSYALGDNPLYRLALYLFVGAVTGYTLGLAVRLIIFEVFLPLAEGERLVLVPLILAVFLLIKGLPRYAHLGNLALAYLLGVGVAAALSGALLGTLLPQIGATGRALKTQGLLNGALVVVGTLTTLLVFTFAAPKRRGLAGLWSRLIGMGSWVGRWFLIVALGVAYAGALTTALSVLIGRVQYLIDTLLRLL